MERDRFWNIMFNFLRINKILLYQEHEILKSYLSLFWAIKDNCLKYSSGQTWGHYEMWPKVESECLYFTPTLLLLIFA